MTQQPPQSDSSKQTASLAQSLKAKTTEFAKKPIPWMYSMVGSVLAMAFMKISPIHQALMEMEIRNIQDYFASELVPASKRQSFSRFKAFWMSYFGALYRIGRLSKKARQDYYALNRQGSFATEAIEPQRENLRAETLGEAGSDAQTIPILIVPGLNTPPVFFREMVDHLSRQGYIVDVVTLPNQGMASVEDSAVALEKTIEEYKQRYQVTQVNVIGHCMGGLIAKYLIDSLDKKPTELPIKTLISLGTGFMGAEGVRILKDLWVNRHPNQPIPAIFDELITWNLSLVKHTAGVAYHSFSTIFDMMVYFRKAALSVPGYLHSVKNFIIEDPTIDHLTLVLNPKMFEVIDATLKQKPIPSFCRKWADELSTEQTA